MLGGQAEFIMDNSYWEKILRRLRGYKQKAIVQSFYKNYIDDAGEKLVVPEDYYKQKEVIKQQTTQKPGIP